MGTINQTYFKKHNKGKTISFLSLILILSASLSLSSCKPSEQKVENLKESYNIQMGEHSFIIPVDYLVDSLNRIDAEEVKKIKIPPNNRDSRYTPHGYVILMGQIPDVSPLKGGRTYIKRPARSSQNVQFNMNYNPGGNYIGVENVVQREAVNETIKLPDFSKLRDGLVAIGYNDKPKRLYEDIYVYIKSKKPIAYIRCSRRPEVVNPSCWADLPYNESIKMDVIFSTENLKWFSEDGGIDKILSRVKSWEEKDKF